MIDERFGHIKEIDLLQEKLKLTKTKEEEVQLHLQMRELVSKVRAFILQTTTEIEISLDLILLKYFFEDEGKRAIFYQTVFSTGKLGFMEKWKIFNRLVKIKQLKMPAGITNTSFVKNVIDIRNKWAHGRLIRIDTTFLLNYSEGTEPLTAKAIVREMEKIEAIQDDFGD